jgi:uncharacterized protein YdbL (DUF1318 family)
MWPLLALVLASCVTINIYFPAAAAEEAARTIVRDVLGKDQQDAPKEKAKDEPQSSLEGDGYGQRLAMGLLDALVAPAYAAEQANINISTPAIKGLQASMTARQSQLAPFYNAGAIGFDKRGLVAVRDLSAVGLRDRSRVKKLVADENRDRNALYREIARANGHPEWEEQIRETFAKVWIQEARPGYWYQAPDGSWRQR